MFYPKKAETFNSINPMKVFIDEKPIIEFVEGLPLIFSQLVPFVAEEKCQCFLSGFFEFIMQVLKLPVVDKFNELFIRRFLDLLPSLLNSPSTDFQDYLRDKQLLQKVLFCMNNLIELRYDQNYQSLHYNVENSCVPLWLFCTEQLIKVLSKVDSSHQKLCISTCDSILNSKKEKNKIANSPIQEKYNEDFA